MADTERLQVYLSLKTHAFLSVLVEKGTHGTSVPDVAKTLIEDGIRRAIREAFGQKATAARNKSPRIIPIVFHRREQIEKALSLIGIEPFLGSVWSLPAYRTNNSTPRVPEGMYTLCSTFLTDFQSPANGQPRACRRPASSLLRSASERISSECLPCPI